MALYIAKRFFSGIVSFLLFSALLFFGVNGLLAGDYADTLALQLNQEERDALREELGIDKSLPTQYVMWLGRLVQGDLGQSYSFFGPQGDVTEIILSTLPATVLVFVTGSLIAFFLGIWLGQVAAWSRNRFLTGSISIASILTYTAFPPWLVFLLTFVLVERFGILSSRVGNGRLDGALWREAALPPNVIMVRMTWSLIIMIVLAVLIGYVTRRFLRERVPIWVYVIVVALGVQAVWRLGGYHVFANDIAQVSVVPFLTYTLLAFGDIMLITRASVLDTKHETYIQLARARGSAERTVRQRHAFPNAILPVITRFVINLPYLLTAIVIIERATEWEGIGDLLFTSVYDQNTYVYMGVMVVVGLVTLIARLVLDLVYMVLDPRIRLAGGTL